MNNIGKMEHIMCIVKEYKDALQNQKFFIESMQSSIGTLAMNECNIEEATDYMKENLEKIDDSLEFQATQSLVRLKSFLSD